MSNLLRAYRDTICNDVKNILEIIFERPLKKEEMGRLFETSGALLKEALDGLGDNFTKKRSLEVFLEKRLMKRFKDDFPGLKVRDFLADPALYLEGGLLQRINREINSAK